MEDRLELPYSKKALKALADTLKVHGALMWVDPTSNSLRVKPVPQGLLQQPQVR